jgi:hypothetical protein
VGAVTEAKAFVAEAQGSRAYYGMTGPWGNVRVYGCSPCDVSLAGRQKLWRRSAVVLCCGLFAAGPIRTESLGMPDGRPEASDSGCFRKATPQIALAQAAAGAPGFASTPDKAL